MLQAGTLCVDVLCVDTLCCVPLCFDVQVRQHDGVPVCVDFGLSRANDGLMTETCTFGTFAWSAPELLLGLSYSKTCDVYSFGMVLYELVFREVPWKGADWTQVGGAGRWAAAACVWACVPLRAVA